MAPLALAQSVDIGTQGTTDLSQGWKLHLGDEPAYKQTFLDDSTWPSSSLADTNQGSTGWRWYRLRVQFPETQIPAALLVNGEIGTYEIYLNERRVNGSRLLPSLLVTTSRERVFPIDPPPGESELAIRVHVPNLLFRQRPVLLRIDAGPATAIRAKWRAATVGSLLYQLPGIAADVALLLAGFILLGLVRPRKIRLGSRQFGACLITAAVSTGVFHLYDPGFLPISFFWFVSVPALYAFSLLLIDLIFAFAGRPTPRAWRFVQGSVMAISYTLIGLHWAGKLTAGSYRMLEVFTLAPAAVVPLILLLMLYFRGKKSLGWLVLPVLFPTLTLSALEVGSVAGHVGAIQLRWLTDPVLFPGFRVEILNLADLLFLATASAVIFFRLAEEKQAMARAAGEYIAAGQIQLELVPRHLLSISGYALNAISFPAEWVGGDFYQVLNQPGGGTLVVMGDVSDTGLKAAIKGSIAVGAVRTLAEEDLRPAELLSRLNRQLAYEADGGFVACLCARLAADGEVTIASAGHVAPYHNSEELTLEPGLPLGITPDGKYVERAIRIEPGDQLTLISNGVVQARDASGSVFGFERMPRVGQSTAETIAETVRNFGQSDDITVLTLKRLSADVDAAATVSHSTEAAALMEKAEHAAVFQAVSESALPADALTEPARGDASDAPKDEAVTSETEPASDSAELLTVPQMSPEGPPPSPAEEPAEEARSIVADLPDAAGHLALTTGEGSNATGGDPIVEGGIAVLENEPAKTVSAESSELQVAFASASIDDKSEPSNPAEQLGQIASSSPDGAERLAGAEDAGVSGEDAEVENQIAPSNAVPGPLKATKTYRARTCRSRSLTRR